jgi:hypothetical protein
MRTKLFFAAAICCSLFFASCSSGPSDATKKDVAAFDSAWTKMSMQGMALSDSLKSAMSMCEKTCKMPEGMECCEHMKGKMDSAMMPCMNDMKVFQDMMSQMTTAQPMIDSTNASFAAFKEKVNKGEIKDDEAKKQLEEFKSKMDNGSKMMADWWNKLNDAKMTCQKNYENCMNACKDMKCTDKKCMNERDKKKA